MPEKKDALRTEGISCVLSKEEIVALDRLRDREGGLSRSAMIRRLIHIDAKSKGLWAVDDRGARVVNATRALYGSN